MGFTVKKGSEKGSQRLRRGSEKGVSRRCLERPLVEYAPLGVHSIQSTLAGLTHPTGSLTGAFAGPELVGMNLWSPLRDMFIGVG